MLHILNGDSTATPLKEAQIEGEILVWREALIAGPTPQEIKGNAWRDLRARYLVEAYDLTFEECLSSLVQQEEAFGRINDHDEVVLWFEHDLFCQTNLIYLLDRLSRCSLEKTSVSLISIEHFPGREDFRGFGELSAVELASLLDGRREISAEEKKLGAKAWAAYCSPTPEDIEALLCGDTSSLPFLGRALGKHLARFPSIRNGLGHIENTALELISGGTSDFVSLFTAFGNAEPLYGYGDLQFLNDMRRLGDTDRPLLQIDRLEQTGDSGPAIHKIAYELTELGTAVLKGKADFVSENEVDFWLGGVHLTNIDHWRWDGERSIHAGK